MFVNRSLKKEKAKWKHLSQEMQKGLWFPFENAFNGRLTCNVSVCSESAEKNSAEKPCKFRMWGKKESEQIKNNLRKKKLSFWKKWFARPRHDSNMQPSDVFYPMVSKSDALPLRHVVDCMKIDYCGIKGLTSSFAQKPTGINTTTQTVCVFACTILPFIVYGTVNARHSCSRIKAAIKQMFHFVYKINVSAKTQWYQI